VRGLILFPALVLVLISTSLGCDRSTEIVDSSPFNEPATGLTVPRPSLDAVEVAVRQQITEQIDSTETVIFDPDSPDSERGSALGDLGRLYLAYDFLTPAESCYKQAEKLDPQSFQWPYYLGFLLQTRGAFEPASAALNRALDLRPDDLATLLRLAEVEHALSRTESARQRFERALAVAPEAAKAHQGLGVLALEANEPEIAVAHLEAALALQPEANALHYPLGRAYSALGRDEEARAHLEIRGNRDVSFPDPLVAAIDAAAVGSALHLTRGAMALAEGRPAAALAEYRLALEVDPGNSTARVEYGLLLAASGDLDGAEKEVRAALDRRVNSSAAHEALGRILEAKGHHDQAVAQYREAIALAPQSRTAHLLLASALLGQGRDAEAEAEYDQVLELDPGSLEGRLGRARARLDQGHLAPAEDDLRLVLGSHGESSRVHLYLAEALQRQEVDAALDHYLRAVELGLAAPERAVAHLSAGNLLAKRGDWEAAIEQLEAALTLDPALNQARFNLAGIHARQGRWDLAAQNYLLQLEQEPDAVAARFFLAEAELRLGRNAKAAQDFAQVVARDPRHEGAWLGEAVALMRLADFTRALARLEEGLATLPRSGSLAQALARLLAACPQIALRDGERALELAFALQSSQESLEHAETVAMALAETGRLDEAMQWQQAVIERAESESRSDLLPRLRQNLALYEQREPCCADPWWMGDP
jgi:tetratricopeptide (TPR) repeat protein